MSTGDSVENRSLTISEVTRQVTDNWIQEVRSSVEHFVRDREGTFLLVDIDSSGTTLREVSGRFERVLNYHKGGITDEAMPLRELLAETSKINCGRDVQFRIADNCILRPTLTMPRAKPKALPGGTKICQNGEAYCRLAR